MGKHLKVITPLHTQTRRDYLARMMDDKVTCMQQSKQYGFDYWDGDRRYGYGGYQYDGRWRSVARGLIETYRLKPMTRILDVGCGKGYLLYEFQQLLPNAYLQGIDISCHALENAKPEIKAQLLLQRAQDSYPFDKHEFDLVVSINALHNLEIFDLKKTLQEITRVGRQHFICVESYRNEQELFNLQCWALTCEAFFSVRAWEWIFREFGYPGDYEFIFFE